MKMIFQIVLLVCLIPVATAFGQDTEKKHVIIPEPLSVRYQSGSFSLTGLSTINYATDETGSLARFLQQYLLEKYNLSLPVKRSSKAKGAIFLGPALHDSGNPEQYQLDVSSSGVVIRGKGAGLFYGIQTLFQLFPTDLKQSIAIPYVHINDQPRFAYRGMHLDVALHFFPVSFVKRFIDLMAEYKLNTFHWHLTEDQGWRIEIKKYPELTKKGAWRAQTLIGTIQNPLGYDGIPHGGFYTQQEIREVVKYALDRYITIVPEIELPGHCTAALAAYPGLACDQNPGPFKVVETWGIFDEVFCAGKETTFTFLEDVLSEVMTLFPGKYIHIGGDEARKKRWQACTSCQKRIKENGLKDEHELQSYFVQRIEKFLNSKGRKMIGWDEILEGGLAPNATVMSWRGEKGGIAAAKQHHDVIMSPSSNLYFDFNQGKVEQEPLSIGNYLPIDKVYAYDPVPAELSPAQQKHVIGIEACVWTEYMATASKVEYMILPRMMALSEVAWSPVSQKDFTNFSEERLPVHLAKLDRRGYTFYVPTALGIKENPPAFRNAFNGPQIIVNLRPPVQGARIYYTLDDIDPREVDHLYEKPIVINIPEGDRRILKTIVVTPSGQRSAVTRTVFVNSTK